MGGGVTNRNTETRQRNVQVRLLNSFYKFESVQKSMKIKFVFSLLLRQYDSVGALIRAFEKTYVINDKTREDVAQMWVGLSQIRSLLPVQMSQEEEELMRERLWLDDLTFFVYQWFLFEDKSGKLIRIKFSSAQSSKLREGEAFQKFIF